MQYVMALDQGTTSSRAMIFDRSGSVVASAQKEFAQHFPRPGWVEHDANEIWSTQAGVAAEALGRARISARQIAAVGIANQRETTVVWERSSGRPVCNAIVWQDRRTAGMCDRLRSEGHEETFRAKTGLVIDPYFSGTKIAWILGHVEGARARAERGELCFGTIDTWLAYNLTGRRLHITDASNASRTLLYNIHTREWDDELLALLGVPRGMLPEVRASSEVYGEVSAGMSGGGGPPLAGIVGDQQAAMMGQVCVEPGLAKCTYGTGCFLLMQTGGTARDSRNRLLTTIAWERGGEVHYALEGAVFVGGAIVQWLRDGLKIIRSSSEVEALAAGVPDTGGVYLVPALAGLGAPHWDPYARGTIVGITRGTTDAHIARAALEGIAFEVADLVGAIEDDAGRKIPELRVDGGAGANNLLMQFQADILGIPVVRPTVLETTALGAACMAGLAVGFWGSVEEIRSNWRADRRFEPAMGRPEAAERLGRWRDAVGRSRRWERGGEG
ncbi:MAG TPA: glycerol kinase GlpK [Phycisphaerales bacterium]|nr:glycerol kinase GlpK [Phycisphaerales bacterium]